MKQQLPMRLLPAPRSETTEMLFRVFGDVLVPVDRVRAHYFRNLNEDTFATVLASLRLPVAKVTLEDSKKALQYIDIRYLAALIDARSAQADEDLHRKLNPETTEAT